MRDVPKTRSSHDQLGCEQGEFPEAAVTLARRISIVDQTPAHSISAADVRSRVL